MPDPQIGSESIYAALLTAAAGVFTTLLTLLVGWLHNKGADSRRTSAIDEAGKRAQFLEVWYRTRVAVTPNELEESRSLVLRELDVAMQCVKSFETPVANPALLLERNAVVAKLNWFRRWFLLYKPVRPLVWLPRLFFYASIALTAQSVVSTFIVFAFLIVHVPSYRLNLLDILTVLVVWVSSFAITLFARWFSIFIDRRPFVRR